MDILRPSESTKPHRSRYLGLDVCTSVTNASVVSGCFFSLVVFFFLADTLLSWMEARGRCVKRNNGADAHENTHTHARSQSQSQTLVFVSSSRFSLYVSSSPFDFTSPLFSHSHCQQPWPRKFVVSWFHLMKESTFVTAAKLQHYHCLRETFSRSLVEAEKRPLNPPLYLHILTTYSSDRDAATKSWEMLPPPLL